jgi:ubiquitin-conjugating enzyme E2 W
MFVNKQTNQQRYGILTTTMSVVLPARAKRRVQVESKKFDQDNAGEGLRLSVVADDLWHVHLVGAAGSLYAGEDFTLRVRFTGEYPFEAPEVIFLNPVPMHCHVYSNGHVCLNILADDWSPALSVRSIVLSIQSMLSSAITKEWPLDNDSYVRGKVGGPKNTRFHFHDDDV